MLAWVLTACYMLRAGSYYPIHAMRRHQRSQCGEAKARQRQAARQGRLGLQVLQLALQWLTIPAAKHGVLVLRSPAVHSARSYVSDAEYEASMRRLIELVGSSFHGLTLWMSPTPPRELSTPSKWFDNRRERRRQLMDIDQRLLEEYRQEQSAAARGWRFQPVFVDTWTPLETRSDRYFDETHVFPSSSYPTTPSDFPRLLASTQNSFVMSCVCARAR